MKKLKFYCCNSLRAVWQLNNKCTWDTIITNVKFCDTFACCISSNNHSSNKKWDVAPHVAVLTIYLHAEHRSLGLHLANLIEVSDEILQSCDQNNRMNMIILPLIIYICSLGTVRMI